MSANRLIPRTLILCSYLAVARNAPLMLDPAPLYSVCTNIVRRDLVNQAYAPGIEHSAIRI